MLRVLYGYLFFRWLLGVLWLGLFIWALADILGSKKDTLTKVVWVVVCLVFPVVGVIVYLLFGRK